MSKGVMYVDNIRVEYDNEPNVLEVCRKAGVEIPNFCFHSDLSVYGACRMCMVEEEGTGKIDAACTMPPKNELHIRTNTARLLKYRRMIIELLLSAHCRDCTTCEKNRACRLQEMAVRFGIHHVRFDDTREHVKMDFSSPAVTMDLNKCILCGDCVRVCHEVQGVSNLRFAGRGPGLHIATADNKPLSETHCVSCGQCSAVCTTGAIAIKNDIGPAWKALQDPQKRVVIQIAPAVRVAIGEAYGLPAGENVLDKLVTALKIMGADEIYDTIFGADLTVREESKEFLRRLVMRHRLDNPVVRVKAGLNQPFSVSGYGCIGDIARSRQLLVELRQQLLGRLQRVSLVVAVKREHELFVLIDQRGLGLSLIHI